MFLDPFPLLGDLQQSEPFHLDLSDATSFSDAILQDQQELQQYIEHKYYPKFQWGLSGYFEYRAKLLQRFPQMQQERRYIHLGADVLAPLHTALHAPLDGTVYEAAYEEGEGNYGGYVVLEHSQSGQALFSMYGHLDRETLPKTGQRVERGEVFARMGNLDCNGHWFIHTHVQLLTERAVEEGWIHRGYCTEKQIASMEDLCPSPYGLLGWKE